MLARVLSVVGVHTSIDLTEAAMQRLVDSAQPEWQYLEYKSQLPGSSDDEKREFARDVAAMANGGGGILIYGIAESGDVATGLSPVALAGTGARLRQMVMQRVQPMPLVEVFEVGSLATESTDRAHGQVVVVIGPTPLKPYAAVQSGRFDYFKRVDRDRHALAEADVERLFRERFRLREEQLDRLRSLEQSVDDASASVSLAPRIYVAGVPGETGVGRAFSMNINSKTRVARVMEHADAPEVRRRRPYVQPGLRCYVATDTEDRTPDRSEFHDDGAYLGVLRGVVGRDEPYRQSPFFGLVELTSGVLFNLVEYGALLDEFRVDGPILLSAGLAENRAAGDIFVVAEREFSLYDYDEPRQHYASAPFNTRLQVDSDELFPGPAVVRVAKALLDDLLSGFRYNGCPTFTPDGSVVRAWAPPQLISWCEQHQIDVL